MINNIEEVTLENLKELIEKLSDDERKKNTLTNLISRFQVEIFDEPIKYFYDMLPGTLKNDPAYIPRFQEGTLFHLAKKGDIEMVVKYYSEISSTIDEDTTLTGVIGIFLTDKKYKEAIKIANCINDEIYKTLIVSAIALELVKDCEHTQAKEILFELTEKAKKYIKTYKTQGCPHQEYPNKFVEILECGNDLVELADTLMRIAYFTDEFELAKKIAKWNLELIRYLRDTLNELLEKEHMEYVESCKFSPFNVYNHISKYRAIEAGILYFLGRKQEAISLLKNIAPKMYLQSLTSLKSGGYYEFPFGNWLVTKCPEIEKSFQGGRYLLYLMKIIRNRTYNNLDSDSALASELVGIYLSDCEARDTVPLTYVIETLYRAGHEKEAKQLLDIMKYGKNRKISRKLPEHSVHIPMEEPNISPLLETIKGYLIIGEPSPARELLDFAQAHIDNTINEENKSYIEEIYLKGQQHILDFTPSEEIEIAKLYYKIGDTEKATKIINDILKDVDFAIHCNYRFISKEIVDSTVSKIIRFLASVWIEEKKKYLSI